MRRDDEGRPADDVAYLRAVLGAPADATAGVEPEDAYDEARDGAVLARVLGSGRLHVVTATRVTATGRARGRQTTRRLTLAVAACVVAVLGIVIGPMIGSQGPALAAEPPMLHYTQGAPQAVVAGGGAPARDALLELADTAAARLDPVPAADETVQRVETLNWFTSRMVDEDDELTTFNSPVHRTTWVAADGAFRGDEVRGGGFEHSGSLVLPRGVDEEETRSQDDLPAGTAQPDAVDVLPREPAALREALLAFYPDGVCDGIAATRCVADQYAELATQLVVPGQVDAAFWAALSEDDAVRSLGEVVDRQGRTGEAFAYVGSEDGDLWTVGVLIADPESGRLIGTESVRRDPAEFGARPVVDAVRVLVSSAWVPAIGANP
ncbi:hypothetical protein KIN34_03545 [Cellulomonas sp. DKR-3]|uniref:Uncharacterized protein n=1 Tax=Cellulomonas fulva TaxID=2835530 RepID=A0ABS5TW69_9CELL|nr:hypothetical protein [Cellulomonas fulva]MBT0993358.1 hypothetical protein [Cellulomonas fulva]